MKKTVFFSICFILAGAGLSVANEAGKYKKFYEKESIRISVYINLSCFLP